jgi:hypothetical protein
VAAAGAVGAGTACDDRVVVSRSDALIRFREAVDVGDVEAALAAARDAGGLADLADSLALLLVLAGTPTRDRYDRAVGRWLARLQQTVPLAWEDRERCARALAGLADAPQRGQVDELEAVLLAHGQARAADELDTFRSRLA